MRPQRCYVLLFFLSTLGHGQNFLGHHARVIGAERTTPKAPVRMQGAIAGRRPEVLKLDGDVEFIHDPSIAKDGDTWYVFSTNNGPERKGELSIRCSRDLHQWKRCGYVFPRIPDWIQKIDSESSAAGYEQRPD